MNFDISNILYEMLNLSSGKIKKKNILHCPLLIFSSPELKGCEGVVYLMSPGRSADIGLQLGKACYPCSR